MYNLLKYSDIYSITSGSLFNYYSDEVNNDAHEIDASDNKSKNKKKIVTSSSFQYKTKKISSRLAENKMVFH